MTEALLLGTTSGKVSTAWIDLGGEVEHTAITAVIIEDLCHSVVGGQVELGLPLQRKTTGASGP